MEASQKGALMAWGETCRAAGCRARQFTRGLCRKHFEGGIVRPGPGWNKAPYIPTRRQIQQACRRLLNLKEK